MIWMQDSPRSKWLGCSHVPSPSSPSRNLGNGGWISLNSSTSLVSTESPSVSSRIGKGKNQDHNRGIAVAPSGVTVAGLSVTLPTPILSPNGSATHHGDRQTARVKTYGDVLLEYEHHAESKCADAHGNICSKRTNRSAAAPPRPNRANQVHWEGV